jgi:hypothetical protein
MEAKIFVCISPDIFGEIKEALFDGHCAPTCNHREFCREERCENEWLIGGQEADENKRFGAGFNVDEPVWDGTESRCKFLEKRKAFDDFVTAGERCENLGMTHEESVPFTKCQAIRKPVGTPPVMNKELIGESQFPWWEFDFAW